MSPLDAYRYATQRWRQANRERDQAAGADDETIARAVHLSPVRVRQLIDKAQETTHA